MATGARRDIRRLAAASAVSGTGDWAATVALSLTVFARTGSTVWLSAAFLFTQLPSAVAAPLTGLIADRLDRRRVMISCDLLAAVTWAGMIWTHRPVWLIALGSTAVLLHAPFGPSSQSAIPNLAGPADLAWANGTLSAASSLGTLVGPAIGGVLYSATGPGPAFGVNALSFAISACLVTVISGPFRSDGRQASEHGRVGVWDGARFLLSQPTLLTLTVVGAVTFMATEIAAVADLPLIHQFGVGGTGYGIMNVAWGAGGLIGARLAARTISEATEITAAVLGVIVFGAFVAAVGACLWFPVIPALMFLFAGADAFAFVGFGGIYQRRTPDNVRGRMFAAVGAVTRLATALSFAAAGFVVQAVGWRPVYLGGGLVDVACGVLLAVTFRKASLGDATATT